MAEFGLSPEAEAELDDIWLYVARESGSIGIGRKVIHALDPDFYMVYRAPASGTYTLKLTAVEDEEPIFNLPRWRENGTIQKVDAFPRRTPWPRTCKARLRVSVTPV